MSGPGAPGSPGGEGDAVGAHQVDLEVLGPWSLTTSRTFWEGFAPAALADRHGDGHGGDGDQLRTVFLVEADWSRARTTVTQHGTRARIVVSGDGDLEAAAAQVARFLSLDVDARAWPDVGQRDPVIAQAQAALPGLRPCGFHSPYEAAAWAVLSQRVRITQAAALRDDLVARHGEHGAFPAPAMLAAADLDLPGRKGEYLRAVADAALEGRLDGAALRALDPSEAIAAVQEIKGIGPFAAELVVLRGAGAPDALARHERHLEAEVARRYGLGGDVVEISQAWRPYRTWATFHLRAWGELAPGRRS